ncbi:hypothetical protein ACFX1S_038258 [Malus domestica]
MIVDVDPFPSATVGMVDAHFPKSKGKGKAKFIPIQNVLKQNSRPQIKIDLFSNEPPTEFSGLAIVESMSDSNAEEIDGPMVLCCNCKARVVLTKPTERAPQAPTPRQPSKTATTAPKDLGRG